MCLPNFIDFKGQHGPLVLSDFVRVNIWKTEWEKNVESFFWYTVVSGSSQQLNKLNLQPYAVKWESCSNNPITVWLGYMLISTMWLNGKMNAEQNTERWNTFNFTLLKLCWINLYEMLCFHSENLTI